MIHVKILPCCHVSSLTQILFEGQNELLHPLENKVVANDPVENKVVVKDPVENKVRFIVVIAYRVFAHKLIEYHLKFALAAR